MFTSKSFYEQNKLILGFLGDHSFEINIDKGHNLLVSSLTKFELCTLANHL